VGAELFHVDGRTDGNDEANSSLFAILRMCLIKMHCSVGPALIGQVGKKKKHPVFEDGW